ncbi:MAG TPA: hypothetical protein VK775_04365 [Chthoniobacterales bacterium]|jgi:hypothetical protein|nr:hypothetical protein [Chthoniobacterales bacterium]
MRAAQTGGDIGLGPSQMDQAQMKQRGAIASQAATQWAEQAQAPAGPEGTRPLTPAQKGAIGGPGNAAGQPGPSPSASEPGKTEALPNATESAAPAGSRIPVSGPGRQLDRG